MAWSRHRLGGRAPGSGAAAVDEHVPLVEVTLRKLARFDTPTPW